MARTARTATPATKKVEGSKELLALCLHQTAAFKSGYKAKAAPSTLKKIMLEKVGCGCDSELEDVLQKATGESLFDAETRFAAGVVIVPTSDLPYKKGVPVIIMGRRKGFGESTNGHMGLAFDQTFRFATPAQIKRAVASLQNEPWVLHNVRSTLCHACKQGKIKIKKGK